MDCRHRPPEWSSTRSRCSDRFAVRSESFPDYLRREEKVVQAPESVMHCAARGERTLAGYDETQTPIHQPADLCVLVAKYPKYACSGPPNSGIGSPERPTSLVEGNRYDTSVAATEVEAKQFHYLRIYCHRGLFAGAGWMPRRSTLLSLARRVAFVVDVLVAFVTECVQQDVGVGMDDTSRPLLMPEVLPVVAPDDLKGRRLLEQIAEAREKGEDSLLA